MLYRSSQEEKVFMDEEVLLELWSYNWVLKTVVFRCVKMGQWRDSGKWNAGRKNTYIGGIGNRLV